MSPLHAILFFSIETVFLMAGCFYYPQRRIIFCLSAAQSREEKIGYTVPEIRFFYYFTLQNLKALNGSFLLLLF